MQNVAFQFFDRGVNIIVAGHGTLYDVQQKDTTSPPTQGLRQFRIETF